MRFGNLGEERGARRGGGNKSELFFAVLQCVRLLIIIIEIAEKLRYSTIVSKAFSSVSWIKKKTHKYGKNQGISLALIANSILENPDMFGYHQVFDKP